MDDSSGDRNEMAEKGTSVSPGRRMRLVGMTKKVKL
jgi:hypothetical protein